jgi:hypothetical protein
MTHGGQATLTDRRPPSSSPVQDAQALIEEARRRHRRRRRWTAAAIVTVAVVALLVTLAVGGFNGSASTSPTPPSGEAAAPGAPPGGALSSPPGSGSVGAGPTSIDFLDPVHGWIATGCSSECIVSNPVIVRTDDGGRTWKRTRVPDMTVMTISPSVWRSLGGVVDVRFVSRTHGWYLQAGELWGTTDGGTTWRSSPLGVVRDFATSGEDAWALVDDCPGTYSLNPCTRFHVAYRTRADPSWRRASMSLSTGGGPSAGALLVAANHTALVGTAAGLFTATQTGALLPADATCQPIGDLSPGRLVGRCGIGGGGDASVVSFALSGDGGRHWAHLLGGPPSQAWSGASTTNGAGELFTITGGATLWRVDTTGGDWAPVLQTTAGTTDELYPIYFADAHDGFVFESGSSGTRLLATYDAGLTWNAVPLPLAGS